MNRPALAHTLAALTDGHVARYADVESVQSLGPITRPGHSVWPWAVDMAAEAVEVLATRGLWPWAPGDDAAPRWWCERCEGRGKLRPLFEGSPPPGVTRIDTMPHASVCPVCRGHTADPPTLAALVAVASLGVETLRTAEELVLQLVGRAPRVTFRVMSREALARWSQVGDGRPVATAPQTIPQAACIARERWQSGDRWDGPSPWWLREAPADVAAAWPALRDLAALGVTPVALDGDRVTLAVEAL